MRDSIDHLPRAILEVDSVTFAAVPENFESNPPIEFRIAWDLHQILQEIQNPKMFRGQ
jgi:hypothetical protein